MSSEFVQTFRLSLGQSSKLIDARKETGAKLVMKDTGYGEEYEWTGTPKQWAVAFEQVKVMQQTATGAQKRVCNNLARIVRFAMRTEEEVKAEEAAYQAERQRRREERRKKHLAKK
jgi:hypothetical protein|tara:strand:+ start:118 stop:465 length:348 start_codon:yes stop_codon:yes gene_type:complete